jgi:hypothetical protein
MKTGIMSIRNKWNQTASSLVGILLLGLIGPQSAPGTSITNYPDTNTFGSEFKFLGVIPSLRTNVNVPGNYVASTADLNSASNALVDALSGVLGIGSSNLPIVIPTNGAWEVFAGPSGKSLGRVTLTNMLHNRDMRHSACRVPPLMIAGTMSGGAPPYMLSQGGVVPIAQMMKACGMVDAGWNILTWDIGCLATNRDANGNLQLRTWPSNYAPYDVQANITNVVADLATNGCTLGVYISGEPEEDAPQSTLATAYQDGYTLGKWGVKWVKFDRMGGVDGSQQELWVDDSMSYFFRQFAAGVDQGAVDAGRAYATILDIQADSRYTSFPKWIPDVGNCAYYGSGDFGGLSGYGWTNYLRWNWEMLMNNQWATKPGFFRYNLGMPTSAYTTVNGGGPVQVITQDMLREQVAFLSIVNGVGHCVPYPMPDDVTILTNRGLMKVWQDPLCSEPVVITNAATYKIIAKKLQGGAVAVAFLNWVSNTVPISVDLSVLPGNVPSTVNVMDVWDNIITGASGSIYASVNAFGARLFILNDPGVIGITDNVIISDGTNNFGTLYFKNGQFSGWSPSVPPVLPGSLLPSMWFDASVGVTTEVHGGVTNVISWSDQAGGFDAKMWTNQPLWVNGLGTNTSYGTNLPIYVASVPAIKSKPAIFWPGNAMLATAYTNQDLVSASAFVVYNSTNSSQPQQVIFSKDLEGFLCTTIKQTYIRFYEAGFQCQNNTVNPGWNVMGFVCTGPSISSPTNNMLIAGPASNISSGWPSKAPAVEPFTGAPFVIGSDCIGCYESPDGNGSSPFRGYIAEILYYNYALSPDDRNTVMAYLRAKYGLQ